MIDTTHSTAPPATPESAAMRAPPRHSFKMVQRDDDRMAGSIPVWERADNPPETAKDVIAYQLGDAAAGQTANPADPSFETALAYAANAQNPAAGQSYDESDVFGFGDVLDMINPLQHIPLVGSVYRHITGDEIKPISRIVGGAVFGGPVGAASGLANVIVQHETGRDIAGNIVALVSDDVSDDAPDDAPGYAAPALATHLPGPPPEERLNDAFKAAYSPSPEAQDLPGGLMSFVDLGGGERRVYERVALGDDDRMAGTIVSIHTETAKLIENRREPVTELSFTPMPREG